MEWLIPIIICVLAGVILLIVEAFMPGFGVPGISGIILLLAGVAMTWYEYGAMVGLGTTVAVLALVGVAISVSLKSASSGRLSKSDLILNDTETPPSENADMQLLVGKEGVVKNTLRPVGTAEFDCGKLHVTSDGEYVSEGQKVRIVRVEGTQIFVTKSESGQKERKTMGFDGATVMILVLLLLAVVLVLVFLRYVPLGLWVRALSSGVKVKVSALIGMRLRRISPHRLVDTLIMVRKAGLDITLDQLEKHLLAGGNIERVAKAMISAQQASIPMTFAEACAIDLAGRDVLQAVQMSVIPKVIETPPISAVAKDGIELRAKARVTVRTDVNRLVGGAGEETIIARVGEGIVTTIGSSETHKAVLENPDLISQTVLSKGLDNGTAYRILSIDIADVDVGRNVGAQLQMDQAEADRRIAQAKAEERRAIAVAREQEMLAAVQEMRARVVEAEAQVPLAMAEALREGKLGVMDYYQMKNVIADTNMRDGIANAAKPQPAASTGAEKA